MPFQPPRWVGPLLSALPAAMLTFSAAMKFIDSPQMREGLAHMGLPAAIVPTLGILELACTALYVFPRTAVLGAILLTGYLGGAISIHVRVGDPWIMPFLLGVLLWGGLYLRDPRVRALIPLRD